MYWSKIKNNKNFFFFLFFLIIIISGCSIAIISLSTLVLPPHTVQASWLDIDPPSGTDQLTMYSGGQSLTEWIPENLIIKADGSLIADAYATFEGDVVFYTHAEIQDIFPDIMTGMGGVIQFKDTSLKWLSTKEYVGNWMYDCTPYKDYYIDFKEIAVGNTYKSHNYEGNNIPISFDIVIPGNFEDERTLNEVTFSRMNMTYQIESIFVEEYHHGTCGDYDIEFIGKTVDHSEIYSTVINGKTKDDKFNEYVAQVAQDMRNTGVGWDQQQIYTESVQTEATDGSSKGTGGPTRAGVCESATFNIDHYQVRPRVDAKKQKIDYKYGIFAIDTDDSCWRSGTDCSGWDWWPTLVYSPAKIEEQSVSPGETYERYLMTKITNQFIHMRFEIKVYFTTTAEIKYELAERILEDPVFEQGNWIMNAEIGGARTYTIIMDPGTSLWDVFSEFFGEFGWIINSILLIIVVAVILYIFIQIGIPALKGAGTALRAKEKLERK